MFRSGPIRTKIHIMLDQRLGALCRHLLVMFYLSSEIYHSPNESYGFEVLNSLLGYLRGQPLFSELLLQQCVFWVQ